MNHFSVLHRRFMRLFFAACLCLFAIIGVSGQTTVIHDISASSLTIPASAIDTFVITGTTTTNKVTIQSNWRGTIILRNLSITSNATSSACGLSGYSCITIEGLDYCSNLTPVTKVDIILDGDNTLTSLSAKYCAIQVNQGAQIHISAIDPNNNASGTLQATASGSGGGAAAIGAPSGSSCSPTWQQGSSVITCTPSGSGSHTRTAGGNIIISSGTINAHGGQHGAGIGGGWQIYYNGIIIIYGGIVYSHGGGHAAGIGSGCPTGSGVTNCYADNSTIIALPPAQIEATSDQGDNYGLAGANNIIYLNDPNKSLITVHTVDTTPNANIYLDLTLISGLTSIFTTLGIPYDLTKVRVGRTHAVTGMLSFRAELQQSTTFFTDASSIKPATLGRPYMPVVTTVTGNQNNRDTVVLPMLNMDISFTDYPSTPLETGYTTAQARQNAHCIKVSYNDAISMTNASYVLQDGVDFSLLIFLAADSTTVISPPTTLTAGMVFYIILPIDLGKPLGIYSDVLLIDGIYGTMPLPNYIRKVIQQRVIFDDSNDNDYLRVTASPNRFATTHPATNTVTLTLNIDHTGTPVLYDPLDVVAKYLVTTIKDYSSAAAANPLHSSAWKSLNVPSANNGNATTTVSFNTLSTGTYYIHWYVESGVVYAHSLTVIDPPALYGGFGPYMIFSAFNVGTISSSDVCNGEPIVLSGTVSTGGNSNYTYKWQSRAGSSGTWTDLTNSNSQNYTAGVLPVGVYYFRRITYDSVVVSTNTTLPVITDTSNVISVAVNPTYNISIDATICLGERYNQYNFDTIPTAAGTIYITKHLPTTAKGCDSIVTLNLTVNPSYNDTIKTTICLRERYNQYNFDTIPKAAGTIYLKQHLPTAKGCDSIVTLQLTTNISYYDTINAIICQNEYYNEHGFDVPPYKYNGGFYIITNSDVTSKGCDSITVLNLTVHPVYDEYRPATIYEDEFYPVGNYKYNTPGLHVTNLPTVEGCDSVINLNLSVIYYPSEITAFSPFNKDGINDYFMAGFKVQIFNRYGALLYETKTEAEQQRGWDGKNSKGQDVQPGLYFYILYNSSGKPRIKSSVEVLFR